MLLDDTCFAMLEKCPWDGSAVAESLYLYTDKYGSDVVRCNKCGLVFAKRRLNEHGLEVYWDKYSSRCHTVDKDMNEKRAKMYELDFAYIDSFVKHERDIPSVLDVGCGEGDFLDIFAKHGYKAFGVEYGHEAATISGKTHKVWDGKFPELDIKEQFDIIVFRGVLQYLPYVKSYLDRAVQLLKTGGMLFITAQPNMDSICAKLFKNNFRLGVNSADFIGFNEKILTEYLCQSNIMLVGSKYFYEETPYADVENDILQVAKAIEEKREGKAISSMSPAFYDNMMSLVYKKK